MEDIAGMRIAWINNCDAQEAMLFIYTSFLRQCGKGRWGQKWMCFNFSLQFYYYKMEPSGETGESQHGYLRKIKLSLGHSTTLTYILHLLLNIRFHHILERLQGIYILTFQACIQILKSKIKNDSLWNDPLLNGFF